MTNEKDEELFESLLSISEEIEREEALNRIVEQSMIELKSELMMPIFDEYYGSNVVGEITIFQAELRTKGAQKKPRIRDPKGGLTAAGRAYFKRKEGANLKPGVKGPANTPEKLRRKGSFLTRFFTNPSGPMKDDKGRATRLALSAAAWGEPVPQDASDAAKLAAKGRRLLERYENSKKKGKKSLGEDVAVTATLSTKVLIQVSEPEYMKGMTQKSLDSLYGSTLSPAEDMRRRRLVREALTNAMIEAKTAGKSYIGGSTHELRRMSKAHYDMAKMRKKKKAKRNKLGK